MTNTPTRIRQASAGLAVVLLLLALSACSADTAPTRPASAAQPTPTTTPVVQPTGVVDELVEVDGARLHARCTGAGDTTIVLIAGFGDGGESWTSVMPQLSRQARVCTYDRFGLGASDEPPTVQTFSSEAADLRALLTTMGEVGPYVVVGHSFGGAEAVAFADAFPDQVRGLALIDASPTNWITALCAVPDDGSEAARGPVQVCASVSDPANNPERLDGRRAFAEVGHVATLGDLPMVVVTAPEHGISGLDATENARLNAVWADGQDAWAGLSSASTLLEVPDTGHYIQVDQPQTVIDQIRSLLP